MRVSACIVLVERVYCELCDGFWVGYALEIFTLHVL